MPSLPADEFVHAQSFKEPYYFNTWGTVASFCNQVNVVKPHWEKRGLSSEAKTQGGIVETLA